MIFDGSRQKGKNNDKITQVKFHTFMKDIKTVKKPAYQWITLSSSYIM